MAGPWEAYTATSDDAPAGAGPWNAYAPAAVEPPEQIPEAMERRLIAGDQARRLEGGLLQTIPQGAELLSTPGGRTRLWEAVKAYPSKFVHDMLDTVRLPGEVERGKVDLTTEDGLDQAIGLGMLVGMGRLNKLGRTGRTSGLSVAMGEKMARIERSPTGEITDLAIGGPATAEDFANAAHIVGGENAPLSVQQKLLRTYTEQGFHPSELAHDAQSDPVIAQRLLSSDPHDLPGSTGPAAPPPPAEGYVRFYHGGDEPTTGGARWLTPSETYARDFRAGESEKAVHFVDIPESELKTNPALAAGYDEINGGPRAFEAPENIAKQLRPFDEPLSGGGKPPGGPPREPPAAAEPGSYDAAQQKILDKISVGESRERSGWTWAKFYRQAVDDLHPIKRVDADAYQLARLTRGQFGKAGHFLEFGTFDFGTYKTNGKALAEILKPARDDLDGVRAYLASKRALEIEATDRKSGMDLDAARKVAADGAAKYEGIAQEIAGYQENVLKYLRDSGMLSDAAFQAMREADKNYVPFYRVFGGAETGGGSGRNLNVSNPVKRLRGSTRDVIDPLESIIKNTYAFISAAERNAVTVKLIDALKEQGAVVASHSAESDPAMAAYLKENGVTNPDSIVDFAKRAVPDSGDTISAWSNGLRKTVKVDDPELVAALRGMDESSLNMVVRVLSVPAKLLRAGSVLSPDFITRNVVRDFLTAFVNSSGTIFSPVDTLKGFKGVITKDADFRDWLKSGGANSAMVALDRRYMQESLQKLTAETGLGTRAWNVVKSPLEGLRLISELAENATRLGEFKKLTEAGASKEVIQDAGYASREVTLDFARIGASMRSLNMIIAFGNAQLQGLDRIGRQFKDRPANTLLKVAGGITLPSVLLWWANHEDPRYQEIPHWQRDLFWIVMTEKHIYRIPKPFELGVVFGSGAERILDSTIGQNPDAFDALGKSIMQVVTPNFIPTVAQPMIEQWANRSSFTDRTLIPKDMEHQLPEYQYTPYTTELTKALGRIISAVPGIRSEAIGPGQPFGPLARTVTTPILMENYIRAWTGGLGAYALQAADAGLRKAGVLPDPVKPAATLADIPFVRAFVVRYPSASAQSIQDFHDQFEVSKTFYDTWSAKAKEGDADAMERIQEAGGPRMFVRLDAINETLSEHSKLVRDIYKNPGMKPDEKRQLIDGLYFNMIEIAKAGKLMMREGAKAAAPAQ